MVLKAKIGGHNRGYEILDGACDEYQLKGVSFTQLLATEFVARTSRIEMAEICREMFVVLARARNDSAMYEALSAAHKFMSETEGSYPFKLKITPEEFQALKRAEQSTFFEWLETTFWNIPFYAPKSGEEPTNGTVYFYLERRFPKTYATILGHVARIWAHAHDELGRSAFSFLCDCADSRRFCSEAEKHIAAIEQYTAIHHPSDFYSFSIPPEDVSAVLQHMRSAMPKDKDLIKTWGEYAADPKTQTPQKIRELLGHAYVKAGGTVF